MVERVWKASRASICLFLYWANVGYGLSIDASTGASSVKYESLRDWLQVNGAELSDKLEIRPSSQGFGNGLFLKESAAKDEILFQIPRKACVTMDDIREDEENGEIFQTLVEKAGEGGKTVAMAGFLAREQLVTLACEEKEDIRSRFAPYLATFPWERGVNNQEHILFWSDDDIESLLKGSLCYPEATALREEVALAIDIMNKVVGKAIQRARGEIVEKEFAWPWESKELPVEGMIDGFPEAVKGAFVCLLTRAFQDGDEDDEKLVPLLDMLQHSDDPNVRHAMRNVDKSVEVRAKQDLEAGVELLNQYRSELEENMPYHRFFTRFGFVPGIVEPAEDLLTDKSSIFFPQKAQV